ncbi:branched-chain amino acid ABC transporter permease [Effusibacillus consociatus]|uniref:Branched-chain amino acid ABC transporter permease n=1 Tax=Effusibacillus consociatus TaxID=1117041 RepID=A0ABV9Q5I7_9BACL
MELIQQLINGLMLGSMYALIAIGYTLVFGILNLLNLAHGEVFMFSGFFAAYAMNSFGLPLYLALPMSIMLAAILGILIERICFRPVKPQYHLAPLVSTIAAGTVLTSLAVKLGGSEPQVFQSTLSLPEWKLGGILISSTQLLILGIALVLMVGITLLLQRTRTGRAMRTLSENPVAAKLFGVNVNRIIVATFAISSLLAGVAGLLIGLRFEKISPFIGATMGLKGLAVMVIGGLGNVYGAMVGGLLIGLLEVLVVALPYGTAPFMDAVVWGFLVLVLLVKPSGLFGSRIQVERV